MEIFFINPDILVIYMFTIKKFTSFDECRTQWQDLEEKVFHYPFQSWWYQKLFADKFISHENLYILGIYVKDDLVAIGGFEKLEKEIIFVGMKLILGRTDMGVTDYGDLLFSQDMTHDKAREVWSSITEYFKSKKVNSINLEFVREDSLTYKYFQA